MLGRYCTIYMWVRASQSFLDGNYSEKNLVGMDAAWGSLTLFERFLVFRVGQVNEKEIEKSKRNYATL